MEGDIQIFADELCTSYPDGGNRIVYARINIPWGFNGTWRNNESGFELIAMSPETEYPDDPYGINLNKNGIIFNWDSDDSPVAGMVVQVTVSPCVTVPQDFFDGRPLVFVKG